MWSAVLKFGYICSIFPVVFADFSAVGCFFVQVVHLRAKIGGKSSSFLEGYHTYKMKHLCYNSLAKQNSGSPRKGKTMAKRRMFNVSIIESDSFCSLPPSAQALYMHLVMNADDDGFVDMWKSLLRYLKTRRQNLDALVDSGYVILFDDGVLLISDWLTHNKIRLDRYTEGRYSDKLDTLITQPNGRYIKASEVFLTPQYK